MPLIFIASPYSDSDPEVVEFRYRQAVDYFVWLMKEPETLGSFIFSPVVHCHMVAKAHKLPIDAEFWRRYNFRILNVCTEVHILRIEGWDKSEGVREEIDFSQLLGKKLMMAYWNSANATYVVAPFV